MSKKFYILVCLIGLSLTLNLIKTSEVEGDSATSTFPADEAGIAAYVKLDSVTIEDLTESLNFFETREKQGATYVIGTVGILNSAGGYNYYDYPHLYIGLDGWLVAYYLKDEPASKIMQWKDYTTSTMTTTLKDTIDYMAEKIGVTYYSGSVKYYDFEFPEANKMTMVAETIGYDDSPNSFSLTIPGTLYEASYSVWTGGASWVWTGGGSGASTCQRANLYVDDSLVFESSADCYESYYGYYNTSASTSLQTNIPHFVQFSRTGGGGAATVLIYKSP